jgi:ribosomal protein S18 acetylase RimI-like enzyme
VTRDLPDGFELDDDPARIDVDVVHSFLSTEAPWALGWSHEEVTRLLREASRVVGIYRGAEMVGFSRTVSDGHWITYLADVFVLPAYRGRGLGQELVRETIENGPYRDLGWLLHTADAHGLYEKFGFERRTSHLMERLNPPP